jgi:hypothetical protein
MRNPLQLLLGCLLAVACSGESGAPSGMSDETLPQGGSGAGGVGIGVSGSVAASAGSTNASGGSASGGMATATAGSTGASGSPAAVGGSSMGGSNEVAGSAGTGGQPRVPGPIDFAYWVLQLPTGSGTSPDQISSAELLAGFSNAYFYEGDDGGQMFMDPAQGITTSGSTHCRTEMREQQPAGGAAAWVSAGTHSMTVEGKVTKLGGGSIAVGQLFNGTDSIPLIELQYTNSHKFSLLYEEAKGGGSSTDLKTTVDLNTRYTFVLAMVDGQVRVTINDKQVYTHTPSAGILANKFYFKFGNYDQSTSAGTPTTTPHSIVEVYKVDLSHE